MTIRNQELTLQILDMLREGYTQREIAINLKRHKNTIYNHVKRIRKARQYNVYEVINRIDSKLLAELNTMNHRDLIAYRRVLTIGKSDEVEPVNEITVRWLDDADVSNTS